MNKKKQKYDISDLSGHIDSQTPSKKSAIKKFDIFHEDGKRKFEVLKIEADKLNTIEEKIEFWINQKSTFLFSLNPTESIASGDVIKNFNIQNGIGLDRFINIELEALETFLSFGIKKKPTINNGVSSNENPPPTAKQRIALLFYTKYSRGLPSDLYTQYERNLYSYWSRNRCLSEDSRLKDENKLKLFNYLLEVVEDSIIREKINFDKNLFKSRISNLDKE